MKKFFFLLLLIFSAFDLLAQVHVRGYYRSNGTYVQPHYRSSPDGNPYNNWSYPGNTNPYTGKVAAGDPDTYLKNYYNRSSNPTNSSNNSTYESPRFSSPSSPSTYSSPSTNSLYSNSLPSSSGFTDYDFEKMNKKLLEDAERSNRELQRSLRSYSSPSLSSYDKYYSQLMAVQNAISYHDRYSYQDRMTLEGALSDLGYSVGITDGFFDEITIKAIKNFQRRNGLKADGRLGAASVVKLGFSLK